MTKANKNNKPWTAADDAELVLMREAKTPTKEIARALNRTPSAVMNRIRNKQIPYGKELTFREVVDTAFAKGEIEFGEPDEKGSFEQLTDLLGQMEKDIKPSKWFPKLRKFLKKLFGLK
mgnify:CR=1 FL=1